MTPDRGCADCGEYYPRYFYSNNQWSRGVGISRCNSCVGNNRSQHGRALQPDAARRNHSTRASFTQYALNNPFAQGAFRWVAKGAYTEGPRNGEACVCKWFKTGGVMESSYFKDDIKAVEKALDLVREWNSAGTIDKPIRLNKPEVWVFDDFASRGWAGQKVLQEPFIENFQKWNSNTGYTLGLHRQWPRVMQALSHFSYHVSGGQFVLCDLQGAIYEDGLVLTDPVILSRNKSYGVTDLGSTGISSFFSQHVCNEYCRDYWHSPNDQTQYHRAVAGTTMVARGRRNVGSIPGRQRMTGFY